MKARPRQICLALRLTGGLALLGSCSTGTTVSPPAPPTAQVAAAPEYLGLPHPTGYGVSDVRALFRDPHALEPAKIRACDQDFQRLLALTRSHEEIDRAMRELVVKSPVLYHWCFYGKILELDDALRADAYIDEKQKQVVDAYRFLVPVAHAFIEQ